MGADLAGEWDDADPDLFDQRIARVKAAMAEDDGMSHEEDAVFDGGFKVPGSIFGRLFDYQKTGVASIRRSTVCASRCCSGMTAKGVDISHT